MSHRARRLPNRLLLPVSKHKETPHESPGTRRQRTYRARGSPRAAAAIPNRRNCSRHALDHLHERPAYHPRRRAARHAQYGTRPRVRGRCRTGGGGCAQPPSRRPRGRELRDLLRRVLLLRARLGQQLRGRRLGARLLRGRLPSRARARGACGPYVRAHPPGRDRRGRPLPGRHCGHGSLGCEYRRDRARLYGGCDRRRPGRPHHHDVRPLARACHHHRDRHRPRASPSPASAALRTR